MRARPRAVREPCASIIGTIRAPFRRLWGRYASFQIARFQRITEPPRTLLVRFGGAPDALLLGPPKPRRNHAVPLGEHLSSYPQK